MRFHSRAFAGTALGLLMAASSASASGVRTDTAGNSTPGAIVVAQADNDAQDQNQKKKERRAETSQDVD